MAPTITLFVPKGIVWEGELSRQWFRVAKVNDEGQPLGYFRKIGLVWHIQLFGPDWEHLSGFMSYDMAKVLALAIERAQELGSVYFVVPPDMVLPNGELYIVSTLNKGCRVNVVKVPVTCRLNCWAVS